MSFSDKYDLEFLDYGQSGWEGIFTTDMEILDDVVQTRAIVTLESDVEAYMALGLTASGTYEKIISVSGTTDDMICISIESGTAGETIRGQLTGFIENPLWSWTIAGDVYLSDTVSGSLTQTPPAVDPQRIGIADSATSLFITAQDGATGPTGAAGPTGATGATGPAGTAGSTTLSGLTDTPDTYDNGKYLQSTASGTQWQTISGSGGVTNHSELNELDYASAGHTGFASSDALTSVSGALQSEVDGNTALIGTASGTLQSAIDGKDNYGSWSYAVDGVPQDQITSGDSLDFVGGDNITITRTADDQITISGSEGVTNHSELNELDYASAGHTGFASATDLTNVSGTADTNTSNLTTLQSDFTTHSGTANIHTVLNDTVSGTDNVWSADKIIDFTQNGATTIGDYGFYQDQKAQNSESGTFTQGAWRTRTLNTTVYESGSTISRSGNVITLTAGTYKIRGSAPAHYIWDHQTRFQNTTDASTALWGTPEVAVNVDEQTRSFVEGVITITANKSFELQHRCGTTRNTDGFGKHVNWGTEVFAMLDIEKIS